MCRFSALRAGVQRITLRVTASDIHTLLRKIVTTSACFSAHVAADCSLRSRKLPNKKNARHKSYATHKNAARIQCYHTFFIIYRILFLLQAQYDNSTSKPALFAKFNHIVRKAKQGYSPKKNILVYLSIKKTALALSFHIF